MNFGGKSKELVYFTNLSENFIDSVNFCGFNSLSWLT